MVNLQKLQLSQQTNILNTQARAGTLNPEERERLTQYASVINLLVSGVNQPGINPLQIARVLIGANSIETLPSETQSELMGLLQKNSYQPIVTSSCFGGTQTYLPEELTNLVSTILRDWKGVFGGLGFKDGGNEQKTTEKLQFLTELANSSSQSASFIQSPCIKKPPLGLPNGYEDNNCCLNAVLQVITNDSTLKQMAIEHSQLGAHFSSFFGALSNRNQRQIQSAHQKLTTGIRQSMGIGHGTQESTSMIFQFLFEGYSGVSTFVVNPENIDQCNKPDIFATLSKVYSESGQDGINKFIKSLQQSYAIEQLNLIGIFVLGDVNLTKEFGWLFVDTDKSQLIGNSDGFNWGEMLESLIQYPQFHERSRNPPLRFLDCSGYGLELYDTAELASDQIERGNKIGNKTYGMERKNYLLPEIIIDEKDTSAFMVHWSGDPQNTGRSGHYTCFVCDNNSSGLWHHCDDTVVKPITTTDMIEQLTAHILTGQASIAGIFAKPYYDNGSGLE